MSVPKLAPRNDTFQGVRTLVLGASGFIGRWVARALAEAGADVTMIARNGDAAAQLDQWGAHGTLRVADLQDAAEAGRNGRRESPAGGLQNGKGGGDGERRGVEEGNKMHKLVSDGHVGMVVVVGRVRLEGEHVGELNLFQRLLVAGFKKVVQGRSVRAVRLRFFVRLNFEQVKIDRFA